MLAAVAGSCPTLVAPAPVRQPLLGCASVLPTPIDWRQSCSALPVKGASLPQATLFSSTSIGELEEVVNAYLHDTRVPFKLVHCVALCTRVPKILAAGFSQGGQVAETNMAKARAAQLLLRLLPTFLSQISHTGSMRSLSNMLWGLAKLELPREQVVAIRADELLAAAFARACHPKTMEGVNGMELANVAYSLARMSEQRLLPRHLKLSGSSSWAPADTSILMWSLAHAELGLAQRPAVLAQLVQA
ncbi:hypothetical protein HaLaN_14626, partial [Haematococcus lacustris]